MPSFSDHVYEFRSGPSRVIIGSGMLKRTGELLRATFSCSRAVLVTDRNVAPTWGETATVSLGEVGLPVNVVVVPPGDASKSLAVAQEIYDRLAQFGVGRDGAIVAVGGGMVTDLAGFVGATWMRGIPTVYGPTTLEAQIDASIGGKTAVNHAAGKNLIGTIHHPRLVVMDPQCLETLPDRELSAGLAESVKHAVIDGETFFGWHETHAEAIRARDEQTLVELIGRNVDLKAGIVARDERDQGGPRALLNLGHTVGHAVEAATQYRRSHGTCVAVGMVAACRLAELLGLAPALLRVRVESLLQKLGLPIRLDEPLGVDGLLERMTRDKKTRGGRVHFVLPKQIGDVVSTPVDDPKQIALAIQSIMPL